MTEQELKSKVDELKTQIARMSRALLNKENGVRELENKVSTPPIVSSYGAFTKLPFYLAPGNVGEINEVVWPYWIPTPMILVPSSAAGASVNTGFQVNAVAGFNMIYFTRTVFQRIDLGGGNFSYEYFNPEDPLLLGNNFGLSAVFRNGSSEREFMNTPIDLDHMGDPLYPHYFASPQFLDPSTNFQVQFFNNTPIDLFVSLQFYGLRVRLDQVKRLMATMEF
jgi:hypothetical protein